MSIPGSERFRKMLDAARERNGSSGTDTSVITGHLAQMRLFMLRQGIEFYPRQDTFGFRKLFLSSLIEENEVDQRLEGVVDEFCLDGKGLWFFRPTRTSYRILWFNRQNYRAYYDTNQDIDQVDLIYSFEVREPSPGFAPPTASGGTERWVYLSVRRDVIKESICLQKPSFDTGTALASQFMGPTRTVRNSLGFIPAVEAFNNMRASGVEADGDFSWLADHIVTHDDMVRNIRHNLHYFGNPTLVSSRGKKDLMEAGDDADIRPTISSQAGFYSANRPSTRLSTPLGSGGGGGNPRVARMVGNLEPTDRVAYITPDAVSGDQNLYARQYREELRNALGGVDELGISSGATAYEIRSLFGRAATTASRKCRGLLTYGLCKLLALVIFHEEQVFRDSFATAIRLKKPVAPIEEDFGGDQKKFDKARGEFDEAVAKFDQKLEVMIREAVQQERLPIGVTGLIPDGDRRVEWRWRGPVFEESTEDILNASIVVRNLQELGVNSIEALRHLFPQKTDEERSAMLSGYPFRMAQATQQSIGTFLSLISDMRQVPHPQAPDLPLLADPRLDLTPYLYRALDFLQRELTYAGQYSDGSGGAGDPATLNAFERARAERGLPAGGADGRPSFVPDAWGTGSPGGLFAGPAGGSGALPFGSGAGPVPGGAPVAPRRTERESALPAPGSLLAADPTGLPGMGASAGPSPFAPVATPGSPSGPAFRFGAADLSLPLSAGLLADPSGTGAALERASTGARKRRVSRSNRK